MLSLYSNENISDSGPDVYTTTDFITWAALRSKEVHPFKVELTDTSIRVSYRLEQVSDYLPTISSGSMEIDENTAHSSTVIWKAVIGFMKMLSRFEVDKRINTRGMDCTAYTTDQYLMWVVSLRGAFPYRVTTRGNDAAFEFEEKQLEDMKQFLFSRFVGKLSDYSAMRAIWRQAKTFKKYS
jgi:hypothetical protein